MTGISYAALYSHDTHQKKYGDLSGNASHLYSEGT